MKKYLLFLIIIILMYFFYPRERYVELNHLAIIKEVNIVCRDNYKVILKEIIPIKKDNGINYQYHKYIFEKEDLLSIKDDILSNKKKLYLRKVQVLKTNCNNIDKIKIIFNFNPKKIISN